MTPDDFRELADHLDQEARDLARSADNLAALHHEVASIEVRRRAEWHARFAGLLRAHATAFQEAFAAE